MKRIIFLFAALSLCTIGSLSAADETIRAVQTRLKEGGFYFGEAKGAYNAETAAAVSRYQIRNGLQISGQLDAPTLKALGVSGGTQTANPPNVERDTWRRLRKADPQFLDRLNNGAKTKGSPAAQPYSSVLVLSRERLRDYVAAFVLAGLDPQIGAELEFFAERVAYFNEGVVGREKIRRDLQQYNQRWPRRRFWLAGQLQVEPQPDSRVRVTFPLRFQLADRSARPASGEVLKTLLLEVAGEDLQIVGVSERKVKRS